MNQEASFEMLLQKHRIAVERYINFRLPSSFDADDVIQETYYAAYVGYEKLRNKELFKSWILSIARNQCNLWFRKKYGNELIRSPCRPQRICGSVSVAARVASLCTSLWNTNS